MIKEMMKKMEIVHKARTVRAESNIKEYFALGRGFGFKHTIKEVHNMEDFNPGVYRIYRS